MLYTIYQQWQVSFAQEANHIIFALQNLPLVGKGISDEWYCRTDIKKILGFLALLKNLIWQVLCIVIYLLFFTILPFGALGDMGLFDGLSEVHWFMWVIFWMNCMLGANLRSMIFETGDEDSYFLLRLMRVDAKAFYVSKMIKRHGIQTLCYWVFFLAICRHMQGWNLSDALCMCLIFAASRVIGEAVQLKIHDRHSLRDGGVMSDGQDKSESYVRGMRNGWAVLMFVICYGATLLFVLLGDCGYLEWIMNGVVSWPVALAAMILAAVGVRYLYRYPKYQVIAIVNNSMVSLVERDGVKRQISEDAYAMDEQIAAKKAQKKKHNRKADAAQETETPEDHLFEDRSGYDYFNALFFHRHKRLLLTPVRLKCKISGVVLVLTGGLFLALRVYLGNARFASEVSGPVWRCYGLFLASLVFIMYCIGSGNSLTMAMFYNCDVSMLRYSFYRTPQAILQNFRIRMRYIIRNNGVVSLVMAAGIFLNCCVLGLSGHVLETLLLTATALMLSVFYSAVSLCMYYLFQPYLEDGKMTGIGYKVTGGIIYVFSYECFQVRTTSILFPIVILIVTVVGLVSSYLLVYKVAPKTFHLK